MSEPIWMTESFVKIIQEYQINEHGGTPGIRDEQLLLSALARPENLYAYGDPKPDIAALAASYAYGIAKNHSFVDGNKRSAFITCQFFLNRNGMFITASEDEKYQKTLNLAEGNLSEEEFADWIREHSVPLDE